MDTKLILFILSNAGLVYIITQSKFFKRLRECVSGLYEAHSTVWLWFLDSILNCPLCCGFWTSAPIYMLVYKKFEVDVIAYAFMGSITAMLVYLFKKILEKNGR